MPRITSVEPQKKSASRRNKRFNIFLDGQFAFGADEDLIVDFRLIKGKVIDQSLLEKLLFEAEVGKLMERMYGLFNIRQRSEKEVRDYLKSLSFKRKIKEQVAIPETAINLVIEKLKQKRLLDDYEFAKAWFESRSKKKGKQLVKIELFKKGIDKEIIDKILAADISESQEQLAQDLLSKRLPRFKNLSYSEKKRKSADFLIRRGFDYEMTFEIIEKLIKKR